MTVAPYARAGTHATVRYSTGHVPNDYWLIDPKDGSVVLSGRLPAGGGVIEDDSTDPRVLLCSTITPPIAVSADARTS